MRRINRWQASGGGSSSKGHYVTLYRRVICGLVYVKCHASGSNNRFVCDADQLRTLLDLVFACFLTGNAKNSWDCSL